MEPISQERLDALNNAQAQTTHLTEALHVNIVQVTNIVFPKTNMQPFEQVAGITKKMRVAAQNVMQHYSLDQILVQKKHISDSVRSIVCYAIGLSDKTFEEKCELMKSLADDEHFGVREWAWMALRHEVLAKPEKSILFFMKWAVSDRPNLRRFSSEITRPAGVWCVHSEFIKQNPNVGLPLLELLKNDSEKYVQNSVANWLNDIAKINPKWVVDLCEKWQKESSKKGIVYICNRASRNIQ